MSIATMPSAASIEECRQTVQRAYRQDETTALGDLIAHAMVCDDAKERIRRRAATLIHGMRHTRNRFGGLDDFLQEFGLSTREGVALMCLAEALLRTPDALTADALIRDKITDGDWERHLGHGENLFVNASTWALMLTGRVVTVDDGDRMSPSALVRRMVARLGEPVIRTAMLQAMRVLGRQFVMGRTIAEALTLAKQDNAAGYTHSFDMLGEGARTRADANRYFEAYRHAIDAIGKAAAGRGPVAGPGISVKLSALHPRYDDLHRDQAVPALIDAVLTLAEQCRDYDISLTIDAEEAARLDLSLDVIDAIAREPRLTSWTGFGLALQAYQKRAIHVVDWVEALARRSGRRMMVRLVKGAYWDTEIKLAQVEGLEGYPVFTRKAATDVSYLACASKLLAARDVIFPQFATHNAQSVATIVEMAGPDGGFEFQRLHGMGEPLYHQLVGDRDGAVPCRIYAPVGSHEDLLPYLVRRLLENGANSSFVHRIRDDSEPIDRLITDPVETMGAVASVPHPKIPFPADLYGPDRLNSSGLDVSDRNIVGAVVGQMREAASGSWRAGPIVGGTLATSAVRPVYDPADRRRVIGQVADATADDLEQALDLAHRAHPGWAATPAAVRAEALERYATLMEENRIDLMTLCVREAGKTLDDAVAELREAVDFCRYYAQQAREHFAEPTILPGPTGEHNEVRLIGRGVFACISPWNFPLAIFSGQVAAALAAGNCVVAKPAEQTPLVAARAVQLLHDAGIPADVLHLLPGPGETIGAGLVTDSRIAGVAFTGSTATARRINQALAARSGPIIPLIAETGGQNAMIVDSTALPEQVADDAVMSAFRSAGQRCSALRVMFIQQEVADRMIAMLGGAAEELRIGDPMVPATDVGPIIDEAQLTMLRDHVDVMARHARRVAEAPLGPECRYGSFFAPVAFELDNHRILTEEKFGPILHIVRYWASDLDRVIDHINDLGYGLTLGVHSRIEATADRVRARAKVGNLYVNRNIIGAVVGTQPFGGEGLSGTGPKAGGPRYLYRFAIERTVSVNTTAAGGNTSLVTLAAEG